LQKIYLYKNLLNFYKININLSLLYSYQFKYSWIETKTKYDKFYHTSVNNYHFIEFFQFSDINSFFEKHYLIDNYVKCKNKFGFFKKTSSIKNMYLSRYNFFKNNLDFKFNKYVNSGNLFFKNFDFVERKLFFYKNNRKVLKNIFKKNKKIEYYMTKFLKKISKINLKNFLNSFEFSIFNILSNSNFFLNKNDVFYFIKNKFVFINNNVITNINYELKKNDVLNVCYNKYYYFLYRKYLNNLNLNINKYSNFFKRTNNKLENDFNFVNKLIIIKNDTPNYLEIDYMSMSLILLYKNIFNYNCFDLKLVTVFLKRLNNWKYII